MAVIPSLTYHMLSSTFLCEKANFLAFLLDLKVNPPSTNFRLSQSRRKILQSLLIQSK